MDRALQFFDTEEETLERIEKLKSQGVSEKDMYVIVTEGKDYTILSNCTTDLEIEKTTGRGIEPAEPKGIFERFAEKLDATPRIEEAFYRMALSDSDRKKAIEEVKNGKYLLYVNQNYVRDYREIKNMCTTDCIERFDPEK